MRLFYGTVATAIACLLPSQLHAIPAWSRLTGAPCSSCHATPTWQLNKDGLAFLQNGHRIDPLKVDTKDQKLENYFSIIFKGRTFVDKRDDARTGLSNTQRPEWQLEQHSMSIYTGGALSNRLSYFAEVYLSENTGATSGGNIVQGDAARKKLAEAFLAYNLPLAGEANIVSFRAGAILPEILHVFGVGARSAEQRSIVLNDALVGNLNTYRPFSRQQGIDATFQSGRIQLATGVLNGADASTTNSIDADRKKDVFGSALFTVDNTASAVGAYYYNGHYTNYATPKDYTTAILFTDDFNRLGLVGRFVQDKWRVVGTYFTGKHIVNVAGTEATNAGYYGLVDYNLSETLGAYVRYDRIDPNTDLDNNEQSMVLVGINGLFFQSEKTGARWQIEYTSRDSYNAGSITAAGNTKFRDNRIWAQLTFGF
ncbi:MAG TPA: hypothetical protein PLJ23_02795 [Gemmatimonadales bacterium]|jgi:hypothetical protein|nr:hypothetical protein [Gemmatimonadales bacterium]